MKKILAALLCLALALGCALASAEEGTGKITLGTLDINGAFTLQCGLPEGYKLQPIKANRDQVVAVMSSEDPAKPVMQLSVAFDETYSDVDRMNDLDEEALAALEKTFTDMDPTVEISYGDTGLGTRLLIAKQTDGAFDYIDFLSIYKGYFIEFVLVPSQQAEDKSLTDEQMRICIDFLTDLDFVPADAAREIGIAEGTWLTNLTDYNPEDNTVQAVLRRSVTLSPEEVEALQPGSTLTYGRESVVVETVEPLDENSLLVNDEITLTRYGDRYHIYLYEEEYTEDFAAMTLTIPESLTVLDDIDPETGDPLEESAHRTAAEFTALLANPGENDPGFASENVYVTFDAQEQMTLVQRFFVPWQ